MANTLPQVDRAALLLRTETPRTPAKAHLRKTETPDFKPLVGAAIDRARRLRGWNLDELADGVQRDARQVARWIDGSERPQFDALFAVESLRKPLVIALAELAGSAVEIDTVIRVRLKESA